MRKCFVPWCDQETASKRHKYCSEHGYGKACQIKGCTRRANRNYSLCVKHYEEFRHEFSASREERFFSFIHKDVKSGCWLWRRCLSNGYGMFYDGQTAIHASHYAYILKTGTVVKRLYNMCGNRSCCNPDHMSIRPVVKR